MSELVDRLGRLQDEWPNGEPDTSGVFGLIPKRIYEQYPDMARLKVIEVVEVTEPGERGKPQTRLRMTASWKAFEREVMGWIRSDRHGERQADFDDLARREVGDKTEQTKAPF